MKTYKIEYEHNELFKEIEVGDILLHENMDEAFLDDLYDNMRKPNEITFEKFKVIDKKTDGTIVAISIKEPNQSIEIHACKYTRLFKKVENKEE